MSRRPSLRPLFLAAVWALCASACAPQIPRDQRPSVVLAVFDPSRGEVPSPNDLALIDGKVALAARADAPAADNELKSGLNGMDGFSRASAPKLRFSSALSAASVSADSIVVLDLGRRGEGAPPRRVTDAVFTYAECDHSVTVNLPGGLSPGHTYLFAARGGPRSSEGEALDFRLSGVDGQPVVPSPAFHFLKTGVDLRKHPDAFPGTRAQKKATSETLEALRQGYEPLFQLLETFDLPRRDVAVLWTVTGTTQPEAIFDPGAKKLPMPNDLLRNPETGLVSLPIDPAEPEASQHLKRGFNTLDGFSLTAPFTVAFTEPVDRATLVAGRNVRVFDRSTREELTDLELTLSADRLSLSIQPRAPLSPNTHYVVVLADLRDDQTTAVAAMPLAQLLRLKNPLVSEARSNIGSLCADAAARLEPLRAGIQPVLDAIEAQTPRASIAAVWTFKTQDVLSRLQALYATPYEKNLPLTVSNVVNKSPLERGLPLLNVARVITGRMVTWDQLDPTTRAFRENNAGVEREIEFVLALPRGLKQGDKAKVVVFGQGMYTERRLSLFVADRLADAGFATMAIDFPLHGERTVCLKDADCAGNATCATDGVCLRDGKPAELARVPAPAGWGTGMPIATGQAFVDVENLFGARDHFRQAIVDLSAQTRLIRKMDWTQVTGGFGLDGERLYYAGISLGGIVGATVAAADPSFEAMLLNVAGAGLPELMQDSVTFGPQLESGLAAKGIERGSPEYAAFVNAAKWVLDEVDPINFARYGHHAPRTYVDPESGEQKVAGKKRLRLHMAIGDTVVPNSSTQRLLEHSKLDPTLHFRSFVGSHGFLANPAEPLAQVAGQRDLVEFLEGAK